MKWILYCSHNSLPPILESYFMERLLDSANGIKICSVIKKSRTSISEHFGDLRFEVAGGVFRQNNWLSYYEQMRTGINAINSEDPQAIVYMCEHDVLYSKDYFENEPNSDKEILKNFNVKILTQKGFFPFETFLHSQTIATLSLWKYCLSENVDNVLKFKNEKGGEYKLRKIRSNTPTIDVRHGSNYTGGRNPGGVPELNIKGWGDHSVMWEEIKSRIPSRLHEVLSSEKWGGS